MAKHNARLADVPAVQGKTLKEATLMSGGTFDIGGWVGGRAGERLGGLCTATGRVRPSSQSVYYRPPA